MIVRGRAKRTLIGASECLSIARARYMEVRKFKDSHRRAILNKTSLSPSQRKEMDLFFSFELW